MGRPIRRLAQLIPTDRWRIGELFDAQLRPIFRHAYLVAHQSLGPGGLDAHRSKIRPRYAERHVAHVQAFGLPRALPYR